MTGASEKELSEYFTSGTFQWDLKCSPRTELYGLQILPRCGPGSPPSGVKRVCGERALCVMSSERFVVAREASQNVR